MTKKYTDIPAITGKQLIRLLEKDSWEEAHKGKHGIVLTKTIKGLKRTTTIPDKSKSLPESTLGVILSDKEAGLGRKGFLELLNKYGLK